MNLEWTYNNAAGKNHSTYTSESETIAMEKEATQEC